MAVVVASPFDDAAILRAARSRSDIVPLRLRTARSGRAALFTTDVAAGRAQCLSTDEPLPCPAVEPTARELEQALEAWPAFAPRLVYFPLVHDGGRSSRVLRAAGLRSWPRSPAPQISGDSLEEGLAQRAERRLGKRVPRRLQRFRRSSPTLRTYRSPEAMLHVERIESRSWKADSRQDMFAKGQAWIYGALMRSPNAHVRVAFVDGEPVAYRFDYLLDGVLHCLKWSYAEAYRSLSPGFYLMTEDLGECWAGRNVKRVDLCGAIDTLKAAIGDDGPGRTRCDFAYASPPELADELERERVAHDARVMAAYEGGVGTRHAYR